ncbi:hypothetical protein MYCTH_2135780 [Thermothelomyces thermophilus ATCC 42464]|uniref:Chitin-binding type-1 domain-containing protein n=1 Tax=Thermothelomyces thermophilus (strain ATCC 42464 / BCRC 31852 / DSM 1799) TaxID=573729 RepID=G2QML2_THET4|nr:uncharacterized protein MYCTH_2135780 [Thermothelomyces thermophilus ATCC 42464]AEO61192.1 hypothetical protein MYCTH_2135780 [Thermothelomyces thermophilus ATCC 42464]
MNLRAERIQQLTPSHQFCDECILKLYRQRLLDPWLPNCSTTLPYTTSASALFIGAAEPTATTISGGVTATTDGPTTTPTCDGQVVEPIENPGGTFPKPNATVTAPGATGSPTYYKPATPAHPTESGTISECGNYYLVVSGDDCFTLQAYNPHLTDDCLNLWLSYDVCVAPVTPGFGDCCSPYGICGSTSDYCSGDNCYSGVCTPRCCWRCCCCCAVQNPRANTN